jgi:lambda family phage tail tape measure protein
MDIARLGVALDPSPFLKGESDVLAALKRIEAAIRTSGGTMSRDSQKAGQAFGTIATAARTAATGIRSAFQNMSNAIGMVSPQLGFLIQTMQGFAGMVGGMISSLRNVGSAASAGGAGFRALAAGIGASLAVIGTLTVAIGALMAVLLPLVAAFKAASFAFNLFKEGLGQASEFEAYTTRFAGMLGGMEQAEKRMASLAKFADKTPFELDEIVRASITLESLTEGMWSSEEALNMIGDAAAKSGLKIDDFADRIGRVFSGVKNGGEWLEPIKTLAGAGGIGGEVAMQMKAAVEAGKTMREVWAIAEASLLKYKGQMLNLSTDFVGRSSTMSDAWAKFTRTLGIAILPAAKDVVIAVTDAMNVLASRAEQWLPTLQNFADQVVAAFMVMTEPGGIDDALRAAADLFTRTLDEGFIKTAERINDWLKESFGVDLHKYIDEVKDLSVWKTIETEILPRLGTALWNAIKQGLLSGIADIGNAIAGIGEKIMGGLSKATGGVYGAMRNLTEQGIGLGVDAVGRLPEAFEGNTPGVVSDAASAAAFAQANDLQLPSTEGAPFSPDAGPGVEMLIPDLTANTKATQDLTKSITDSMFGKPKGGTSSGIMIPQGPSNALFPPETTEAAPTTFSSRIDAQVEQMRKNREQVKASRVYTTPVDKSASWDEPTGAFAQKAAAAAKKGGKAEKDPLQAEADKITAGLRTPTEEMEDTIAKLQELKDAGKISAETFDRGVAEATEKYEGAVDKMTKKAKSAAKEQEGALAGLMKQWGDLAKQIDQSNAAIAQSVSTNLTGAIVSMIDGTKSAKQAFSDMAAAIVNDILKIITQMMVQYAIQSALGMVTGGFGGAVAAGVKHSGGMVGGGGPSRMVDPAIFAGATRHHSGGVAGLQPGEVPIIAEKGEAIMTEDQQAAIKARLRGEQKKEASGSGQAVTILNVTDPRQIEEHLVRNPQIIMNIMSRQAPKLKQILNQS